MRPWKALFSESQFPHLLHRKADTLRFLPTTVWEYPLHFNNILWPHFQPTDKKLACWPQLSWVCSSRQVATNWMRKVYKPGQGKQSHQHSYFKRTKIMALKISLLFSVPNWGLAYKIHKKILHLNSYIKLPHPHKYIQEHRPSLSHGDQSLHSGCTMITKTERIPERGRSGGREEAAHDIFCSITHPSNAEHNMGGAKVI